jgi:hypothetical protein
MPPGYEVVEGPNGYPFLARSSKQQDDHLRGMGK